MDTGFELLKFPFAPDQCKVILFRLDNDFARAGLWSVFRVPGFPFDAVACAAFRFRLVAEYLRCGGKLVVIIFRYFTYSNLAGENTSFASHA
jgi:hypothetical protein